MIDDGSPDKCPEICDRWSVKDERVTVIHQVNKGLSDARNTALDIVKGEYICFVDSDDWLETNMIETLLMHCLKTDCKLAACGRFVVSGEHKLIDKCWPETAETDAISFLSNMLVGKNCDSAVWDKLYHKSLWDNVRFPSGKIYEDIAVLYKVVLNTNKVITVNQPLYNYFRHKHSITSRTFNSKLFDYPNNTRHMLYDIQNICPKVFDYACWSHIAALQTVLHKISVNGKESYKCNKNEFKNLTKEIFSYRKIWIRSKVFSVEDKVKCIVFSRWYLLNNIYKLKKLMNFKKRNT